MKPAKNRPLIFAIFASLALGGFAIYYFKFIKKAHVGQKVEKSITEILEDRARDARIKVSSELGQSMIKKDWAKFDQLYKPENQYKDFADIIRGAYIQNEFVNFLPKDFDELTLRAIRTFKALDQKQYPKLGLLITQFNRLPAPEKTSEAYKDLKQWLKSETPLLKRLALFKMVGPDSNPDPSAVKTYIHGFTGDTFGMTRVEWIRFTDEIRNIKVRKECIKELSALYLKMEFKIKPVVLTVISHEPSIETAHLIKYTMNALSEDDTAQIEAGLRAITPLLNNKLLDSAHKRKILERINQIPANVSSAFIQIKINEIKSQLSSSS